MEKTTPMVPMGAPKTMKHYGFAIAGYLFFALGWVGMFVPVLPTTVFWIVAAVLFARSCPAMYRRIVAWPRIGPVVENFLTYGVISRRGKMVAGLGMAVSALIILATVSGLVYQLLGLGGLMIGATYVATRPERRELTERRTGEQP
ncbi:MAG: YbaN family protein [Magnetospiraceae bacterium]